MEDIWRGRGRWGLRLAKRFRRCALLAVVDGLDAVDAAVGRLVVVADFGFVCAPEVGDVGPGLGADIDLVLMEHGGAALGDGVDPVFNGEDVRGGCAVGGDADGDQASVRKKERAEAGAVPVGRAGDGGVDGLMSWSRAAVEGQAGTAAIGSCAWMAGVSRAAARARISMGGAWRNCTEAVKE